VNFDLSDEQRLLEDSLDKFLANECPIARVRQLFDGDAGFDPELFRGLGALGVLGLLIPEEFGGGGRELLDLAVVAEVMGRRATPGPFLEHVLAALAIDRAGSPAQRERWLPGLATGGIRASLALAEPGAPDGGWCAEQWELEPQARLSGVKQFVPHALGADLLVVGLRGGGLGIVEADRERLEIERLEGLDRTRRFDRVTFHDAPCDPLLGGRAVAHALLDAGLVLLAADAHGGGMACVGRAVEYAKTREQFGVKIGSFQALKHQLADMALEIHPTRGLVWFAAHAFERFPEQAPAAAANAKAHVAERFVGVARRCVEAHGGIGYTWECDVQFWLKRALYDWAMLGDPHLHRRRTADLLGW
jgi:alkylation response protein AidB-like acyl-CoA dehydrogenase